MNEVDFLVGTRFKMLLNSLKMNQKEFSKEFGIAQGYVSEIATNKFPASPNFISILKTRIENLNLNWLLTGDGEMFLEKKEEQSEAVSRVVESDRGGVAGLLEELFSLIEQYEKNQAALEERMSAIEEKLRKGE